MSAACQPTPVAWGASGAPGARAGSARVLALIPARLESTRLPRKMLLRQTGQYLFEHTARAVLAAPAITRAVVATDSAEILAASTATGLEAVLTSERHKSGSDRVHEAWRLLARDQDWDIVLNVQGDEPEIDTQALGALVELFADPAVELASLWAPLDDAALFANPNAVKVVCDRAGWALYFSRAPIPSRAHPGAGGLSRAHPGSVAGASAGAGSEPAARLHLGVYAFRPAALERFCALPPSPLEAAENLEQLRWLDAGGRIRMARAACVSRGIDTAEDYAAFCARWAASTAESRVVGRTGG